MQGQTDKPNEAQVKRQEEKERPAPPSTMAAIEPSDIDRIQIGRRLGMENYDDITKNQTKIDRLIIWAKSKGAKNQIDMIGHINKLKRQLGGSATIYDIVLFAQLDAEKQAIKKQMSNMNPHV